MIGCSSAPRIISNTLFSADDVRERVNSAVLSVKNISTEGSITVTTPTIVQTAGFELASRGFDSVKLNLYGPFGITAGTALLTKHTFVAYNALKNTVYQGSPEKQIMMFPMIKDIPVELLIGTLQGSYGYIFSNPIDSLTKESVRMYSFAYRYANGSYDKIRYNSEVNRIIKCTRMDSSGTVLWSVQYWYKQSADSVIVPEQVEISVPSKESQLLIEYSDVSYDNAGKDFRVIYPSDAEVITIE